MHCGSVWTTLRVKNSSGTQSWETRLCEFCLQELYQVLTVSVRENPLVLSVGGGRKESF